jgi:hypothetical protein
MMSSPLVALAWAVVFVLAALFAAIWIRLRVADARVLVKKAWNALLYRRLISKLSRAAGISREEARALCERDDAPELLESIEARLAYLRDQQTVSETPPSRAIV